MVQKLVEPGKNDLIAWFKTAGYGDQCQIVTRQGYAYTRLTKVSPSMVKWQVSGFTNRNREFSKTFRFTELLATWNDSQ